METSSILSKGIQIGIGYTAPALIESNVVDGWAAPIISGGLGFVIMKKTKAKEIGLGMIARSALNVVKRAVNPTPGTTMDALLPGSSDRSMFVKKLNGLPSLSGMGRRTTRSMRGLGNPYEIGMIQRQLNGPMSVADLKASMQA